MFAGMADVDADESQGFIFLGSIIVGIVWGFTGNNLIGLILQSKDYKLMTIQGDEDENVRTKQPKAPSGKYYKTDNLLGRKIELQFDFKGNGKMVETSILERGGQIVGKDEKNYTWEMNGEQVVVKSGNIVKTYSIEGEYLKEKESGEQMIKKH